MTLSRDDYCSSVVFTGPNTSGSRADGSMPSTPTRCHPATGGSSTSPAKASSSPATPTASCMPTPTSAATVARDCAKSPKVVLPPRRHHPLPVPLVDMYALDGRCSPRPARGGDAIDRLDDRVMAPSRGGVERVDLRVARRLAPPLDEWLAVHAQTWRCSPRCGSTRSWSAPAPRRSSAPTGRSSSRTTSSACTARWCIPSWSRSCRCTAPAAWSIPNAPMGPSSSQHSNSFTVDGHRRCPSARHRARRGQPLPRCVVFPNVLLDVTGTSASLTSLFPIDPSTTAVMAEYLFAAEDARSDAFDPAPVVDFDRASSVGQDYVVCERVQSGVCVQGSSRPASSPTRTSSWPTSSASTELRLPRHRDTNLGGSAHDRTASPPRDGISSFAVPTGGGARPRRTALAGMRRRRRRRPGQRTDRRRSEAGERAVAHLQLCRLRQSRRRRLVREQVRRQGRVHHVRHRRRVDHQVGQRCRRRRPPALRRAEHAEPADRGRVAAAAQQVVPAELLERARRLRQPVVRLGIDLHRAVHGVLDRHRVPRRHDRSGGDGGGRLGHPVGPDVQGRDVDPRRLPRRALDGDAAPRPHRRQHGRRGRHPPSGCRSA